MNFFKQSSDGWIRPNSPTRFGVHPQEEQDEMLFIYYGETSLSFYTEHDIYFKGFHHAMPVKRLEWKLISHIKVKSGRRITINYTPKNSDQSVKFRYRFHESGEKKRFLDQLISRGYLKKCLIRVSTYVYDRDSEKV